MSETEVDLVDEILDAVARRGESMVAAELVELVERHDPATIESNAFGVSTDRLLAYAEAVPNDPEAITADDVREALAERTVESESWVGGDTLYATDQDHVSVFPRAWHEALAGEDDVRRFAAVILAEVGDSEAAFDGGPGVGVPENRLLDAVAALGTPTREEAKERLEALREEGVVTERLDQHPDARVELADVDHG